MSKRTAVSVLLTRDPESSEVYLIERNPKLKFFGGYYAFPGGTLDAEDHTIPVASPENLSDEVMPYIVAAAREVLEETGVLLTRGDKISASATKEYRRKLLSGAMNFSYFLQHECLEVDVRAFHVICKIVTPEFSPVRYETYFLWASIPDDQTPEIWEGELMAGEFVSAEDALSRWKGGEILVVPPVIVMLQELVGRKVRTFTSSVVEIAQSYLRGKIHRVYFTPGIQMVTLKTRTLLPATHTNAYVIGESEIYVVDPAPSDQDEQAKLWDYLDDLLKEDRKLKGILLTHHHSDHVGALGECQAKYGLPLLAHEKTAAKLVDVECSQFLNHGDELPLGTSPDGEPNWKLQVLHTPGHASGHLAFRENRYGAVIAGDLISTVSTIVISPPDGHLATYLDSLRQLQSVTDGTLYPSHGPAVREGKRVIQYYLKHREERELKLLAALSQTPSSSYDLVRHVYDDVDSSIWPLAEHSLRAGLIKLIEEGRCKEVSGGYVSA
jgi:glyoxylase-like metal-dependent hydrolase (beta-lactamase superfamily II)/8-oxo-dGTP pyrophosphatase MutT (NUDIX family)